MYNLYIYIYIYILEIIGPLKGPYSFFPPSLLFPKLLCSPYIALCSLIQLFERSYIALYTVLGKTKSPQEDFWPKLVTAGTCRYQDRWNWFLLAFRSTLNLPGPRGKTKIQCFRTQQLIQEIRNKSLCSLRIPFKGPYQGGDLFKRLPREVAILRGHVGSVESVAWSPDGKKVALGSSDRTTETQSGHEIQTYRTRPPGS